MSRCVTVRDLHVTFSRARLFKPPLRAEVLKGLSFNVDKGDSLAVIGRNGAGKSTLLRVLAGIIEPDQGTVDTGGQSIALLALGAGMMPECSGRANAIIQAMLQQNITRREAEKLVPKVISFAELEGYEMLPMKNYSRGMQARLKFAVATQIESDILLVDEVLAVGDIGFQEKSRAVMKEKLQSGTTIIIVTHNLNLVQQLCNKAIWIENGEMRAKGDPKALSKEYLAYWKQKGGPN